MEDSFNIPQSKLRNNWMEDEEDNLESVASFFEEELETSCNSMSSSSSDEDGDATSSNSSSSSTNDRIEQGSPLFEMSSLLAQLPIKRGLSKHFQGKSQSFTSLSSVRCLDDLIKPEKLYKKKQKLKPSKSSNTIAKKSSRSTFSALGLRRRSFLSRSTSIAPQRQGSRVSNQTLLFA